MSLSADLPPSLSPARPAPDTVAPLAGRAGLILYVGLASEEDSTAATATRPEDIAAAAEMLRDLARELLPAAETFTALSLVPTPTRPDDVRTVRDRVTRLQLLDAAPDVLGGSGDAR
ncbi:hypothetical protein AB6N24_15455 [Cellulomonas sp. 179-A 4D5 NHS]|uniref:hypothetical protein n=1 Tax=Cellulomonas sp. 179-A 4D5 NHS TaxID=3142378 RepID=UPI0039A2BD50